MTKKMLIDATHVEETRVVIVDGTKLDELDIETSTKKQLKGNIYLAKVARVEPSLQAAFVDYGGNRHGFLAFNEIHPDYYQIPVADREALKEALMQEDKDGDRDDEHESAESDESDERTVETVSENEADEVAARRFKQIKKYKIQEVIHRGQVLLVQVIKEERGNKGAALTTYLSLAGRYCVLMPNNARGGGVSRKITNAADRKRLKGIVAKLPLPTGMSVIVRTAGKERTSLEIKRDYDYLIKTWVQIRDTTMESSAPALIHEEGNLIKRALRDMYTRDIEEILIEGEAEYKMARDFMKMLTPSHAKKVKLYKDETIPLFFRYQVESQLEALHSNIVQLKSGAYLVMDQTEALVAIDVNSGRATKERNIEETALKTNLEAADEIARQLRLRDMAGLVVIDFIDMEEARNNHAIERRMKEALKRDRARVQMGRITGFGLMELSRQRLHSSFIETSYSVCPHCRGKGMIRSTQSASIHTLHVLEEESMKLRFSELHMTVPPETALYVLNYKRRDLNAIETMYNVKIFLEADASLVFPTDYRMERVVREEDVAAAVAETADEQLAEQTEQAEKSDKKDRRGRRGRNRRERQPAVEMPEQPEDPQDDAIIKEDVIAEEDYTGEDVIKADDMFEEGLKHEEKEDNADGENNNRRRHRYPRRDRRFGRKHRFNNDENREQAQNDNAEAPQPAEETHEEAGEQPQEQGEKQNRPRRRRYPNRRRHHPKQDGQPSEQQDNGNDAAE
ncbi:MAG TPA: ribonuclease E/G [Alphaproteobacteria bacterium]|nr:ribonuclease E/G [Alphaproteobacteria bacterium]